MLQPRILRIGTRCSCNALFLLHANTYEITIWIFTWIFKNNFRQFAAPSKCRPHPLATPLPGCHGQRAVVCVYNVHIFFIDDLVCWCEWWRCSANVIASGMMQVVALLNALSYRLSSPIFIVFNFCYFYETDCRLLYQCLLIQWYMLVCDSCMCLSCFLFCCSSFFYLCCPFTEICCSHDKLWVVHRQIYLSMSTR